MPVDLPTMNSTTINLTYLPITQNLRGGGGGGRYSLKWLTQGCATGQGMVFWPLCPKQGVYFVICPKHGPKIKGVPLNRVGILAAALYPNMGQVPPSLPPGLKTSS